MQSRLQVLLREDHGHPVRKEYPRELERRGNQDGPAVKEIFETKGWEAIYVSYDARHHPDQFINMRTDAVQLAGTRQ